MTATIKKTNRADLVVILLSTYNGEAWLVELLDSLTRQTHKNWVLYARDDISHDGTLRILEDYSKRDPRVRIMGENPEHLGPQRSFFWLLERTVEAADYIMFCDQDDVWHPDKIAVSLEAMWATENEGGSRIPSLVHTDMRLVGENLELLYSSAKKHLGFKALNGNIFPRLLAQNFVTGCTMMINRSLARASLPLPADALMHDWWIALVAAGLGRIAYVKQATIDYRQHSGNASGCNIRRTSVTSGLARLIKHPAHFNELMEGRFKQCLALESHLARFPTTPGHRMLSGFLKDSRRGRVPTVLSALKHGLAMQGAARNVLYYFLLLKKRYLRSLVSGENQSARHS